jgi:hypothetical protein
MPYPTNADLPSSVRSRLPERAQDVYSEAFSRLRDSCGRATAGGSGASHRLGGGQALACQSRQQLERASVVIFFCAASARSELSEKFAVIFDHGRIDRDQYRRVGEL